MVKQAVTPHIAAAYVDLRLAVEEAKIGLCRLVVDLPLPEHRGQVQAVLALLDGQDDALRRSIDDATPVSKEALLAARQLQAVHDQQMLEQTRAEVPAEEPLRAPERYTVQELRQQPRRIAVLRLASQGLTNKQIGAALCVSENTVKSHFDRCREEYGHGTRMYLVNQARERGVI